MSPNQVEAELILKLARVYTPQQCLIKARRFIKALVFMHESLLVEGISAWQCKQDTEPDINSETLAELTNFMLAVCGDLQQLRVFDEGLAGIDATFEKACDQATEVCEAKFLDNASGVIPTRDDLERIFNESQDWLEDDD